MIRAVAIVICDCYLSQRDKFCKHIVAHGWCGFYVIMDGKELSDKEIN